MVQLNNQYLSNYGTRLMLILLTVIFGGSGLFLLVNGILKSNFTLFNLAFPCFAGCFLGQKFSVVKYNQKVITVQKAFASKQYSIYDLKHVRSPFPYINIYIIELKDNQYWFTVGTTRYLSFENLDQRAVEMEMKLRSIVKE